MLLQGYERKIMIVIRIEIHPNGDWRKARLLGTGVIVNDCTGTLEKGNYETAFYTNGELTQKGRFTGYNRLRGNVWSILKKALTSSKKVKPFMEQIQDELEKPDGKRFKNPPPSA
jgi:hypothetical protein